ncbi:hypothetical protein Btru_043740 [Bulinus truncatus]|nr:hypothetical protein Btru_043740 [Bulinus truncatus]
MAEHGEACDVIITFGPPIPNKLKYIPSTLLKPNYTVICLETVYQENPHFGLRDIAVQAVASLQKQQQVVLIGDFRLNSTRDSLCKIICSKIPTCCIHLVQILPLYGYLQIMWQWQYNYALENNGILKDDSLVKNWFDTSTENIDFETGYVQKPKEDEYFSVETVYFPLQIETLHKLDITALFIQWEGALHNSENGMNQIITLGSQWISKNPFGRIIYIIDGNKVSRDVEVERFLRSLAVEINAPVYAMQLDPLSSGGTFCSPPQPGILAFLQQRHCLNLHSKDTCYIYETQDHMQLAQAAGVRHLKMSHLQQSADLYTTLKSQSIISTVTNFLKKINILEDNFKTSSPNLPLFDLRNEIIDGHFSKKFSNGIEEHVFVKDRSSFCKYQEKFLHYLRSKNSGESNLQESNELLKAVRLVKYDHKLPDWMKTKTSSDAQSNATLQRKYHSESSDLYRFSKTEYFMSEKELLKMASDILHQVDERFNKSD